MKESKNATLYPMKRWCLILVLGMLSFSRGANFFRSKAEERAFNNKFLRTYRQMGKNYENLIHYWNPLLSPQQTVAIAQAVLYYTMYFGRSRKTPLDPRLVMAVIKVESDFHLRAVSSKGALGLGQLMPATAASVGLTSKHVFHPQYNIYGTVRVLQGHFDRYSNLPKPMQYAFALASYNAGPNAVAKYGGVPPYSETIRYIQKVTAIYRQLAPDVFLR